MDDRDDDELRAGLRGEARRDLPGPAFGRRVMEAVEEERERVRLTGPAPAASRRVLGVAAAIALVALGVWAVADGRLSRLPAGAGDDLAAPGVELPPAKSAVPALRPLKITLTAAGVLRLDGVRVDDLRTLPAMLATRIAGGRPAAERDVILRIDRHSLWREVQWLLKACADPDVRLYRIHFAVEGPEGPALLPEFLPRELRRFEKPAEPKGIGIGSKDFLSDAPFPRDGLRVTVVLKRTAGETGTRIRLLDRDLGEGEAAFRSLGKNLAVILRTDTELPLDLNAWPEVPYEDVIRALDAWHSAGGGDVTLTGLAPGEGR